MNFGLEGSIHKASTRKNFMLSCSTNSESWYSGCMIKLCLLSLGELAPKKLELQPFTKRLEVAGMEPGTSHS